MAIYFGAQCLITLWSLTVMSIHGQRLVNEATDIRGILKKMNLKLKLKNHDCEAKASTSAVTKLSYLTQEIDSVQLCPHSVFPLNLNNYMAVIALISNYLIILINFKMVSPPE